MIVRSPASTCGTGRNCVAGTLGPSRKSHHGAHRVDSSVVGGELARFLAASHWMTKSTRRRCGLGSSRRWRAGRWSGRTAGNLGRGTAATAAERTGSPHA